MRRAIITLAYTPGDKQTQELAETEISEAMSQLSASLRNQVQDFRGVVKFENLEDK